MKWNQLLGGILIGLGFGLYLGGALVDLTGRFNSTSAAGVGMMLVVAGAIASGLPGWVRGRSGKPTRSEASAEEKHAIMRRNHEP